MGRYASISSLDVSNRYPRVLTDSRATDVLESAYLSPAEAELDMRLGSRFTVPFSSNNATARDLTIDMTIIRWGMYGDDDDKEVIQASVDSRIKALLDGTMVMVTTSGQVVAYPVSGVINTNNGYPPVFGMGDVMDMKPSTQRVEDEEAQRD